MGRVTERRKVIRIRDGAISTRPDTLVAEEPLEIRLNGKPLAITMRTPGDDFALAAGFLVSEGVLGEAHELQNIVYCAGATGGGTSRSSGAESGGGSNTYNIVDVKTASGVVIPDITLERNMDGTKSDEDFKTWFQTMFTVDGKGTGSKLRRSGSIVKLQFGVEVLRFAFEGAWIKSSKFSDLDAASSGLMKQTIVLAIERMYRV